jgi:hypothetical protein
MLLDHLRGHTNRLRAFAKLRRALEPFSRAERE